jgi:hypothetical protein
MYISKLVNIFLLFHFFRKNINSTCLFQRRTSDNTTSSFKNILMNFSGTGIAFFFSTFPLWFSFAAATHSSLSDRFLRNSSIFIVRFVGIKNV